MGNNPIAPVRAPSREEFHLGRARAAFLEGRLNAEGFERRVAHILRGGYLSESLALRSSLLDRVRTERRRRACPHARTIELCFNLGPPVPVCADCGKHL